VLLNNLAAISTARGDYSGAQDLFHEALILARSMNDRKGIRLLDQNIGEIKFYLGDYESSMSSLQDAVLTAEELGDRRAMGTAHGKLGLTTCLRNLPEEARPHLEKAVEFSVEAGDMTSAHEFMFFLARVYLDLEDRNRLEDVLQRMKAVPERLVQLDNRWYTQTAVMLYESYLGNRDEALAMAVGITETFPNTEAEALARITMFELTGRASEVEKAVRVYRRLHDSQPMAYYLERIGYLEALLAV
jgi:tetratricopeptide (TPR) repeat protein